MNEIQIFSNPAFGEIRTVGTSENPLFCLTDLCRQLAARLDHIESMLAELLGRSPIVTEFKDVMDTNEIAAYLNVTPGHIRKLVSDGKIPCYKPDDSNRNFFKRTEIDAWRASNKRKSNRELAIEIATKAAILRVS